MASFFNDGLDDPPVFDVCSSFDGGQVSNVRSNLLKPNEAALLQNFDITKEGEAITRRGSTRLGGTVDPTFGIVKGLTYYDTPSTSYLVAGTLSGPRYYNGTTWPQLSVSIPTGIGGLTANDVIFAQGINKLYMADAYNNIYSWDGTTAVDLGNAANNQPPAGTRWINWHTDRLVAAGMDSLPDSVYFSQFLDGATWDKASWSIRVGAGEGDAITGMVPRTDFNLVVMKRRSIWVVNCDPTLDVSQFEIKPITRVMGCVAPKTAVQVGDDVFMLTTQGVRSVKRTLAAQSQQDIGPAISQPVNDILNRINPATVARSAAIHWNNRYILSLPLDGASAPNYVLVFNTLTNTWSGLWTGWTGKHFSYRVPASGQPARMVFENNNFVHEWLDYILIANENAASFQDNGTDIATRIVTRAMNFDDPVSPKTGLSCEIEYVCDGSFTAQIVADTANVGSAVTINSTATRRSFDLQSVGPFRELQLDLNSTAGQKRIRHIHASAFTDTMPLQTT